MQNHFNYTYLLSILSNIYPECARKDPLQHNYEVVMNMSSTVWVYVYTQVQAHMVKHFAAA